MSNPATQATTTWSNGASVSAELIQREERWDELRESWGRLFAASAVASPPLRFDWLREWWRIYGPVYGKRSGGLRVIAIWRGGELIGALPLYERSGGMPLVRARRLSFISTGEAEYEETCPDYMDLLHAEGEAQACVDAVVKLLENRGELPWDELDLTDLGPRSPLLSLAIDDSRFRSPTVVARGACPIADISGGLEAYLGRLSANTRQQSRRLLRNARNAGAQMRLAADAQSAERFFDDLIALHQTRWRSVGQKGCFAARRFTEFHRSLVRAWSGDGRAIVARLEIEERPIAVIYGFPVGSKFDFYQSGTALRCESLKSPGIVAFLMLMQRLAERGIETFDFLRGASEYKQRLATGTAKLWRVRIVRPTLRAAAHGVLEYARRAASKGRRMLRLAVRGLAHAAPAEGPLSESSS